MDHRMMIMMMMMNKINKTNWIYKDFDISASKSIYIIERVEKQTNKQINNQSIIIHRKKRIEIIHYLCEYWMTGNTLMLLMKK